MRETKPTESKIRALLIDDDQGFSSSVKRALADDFEVTIAPDGRKGFALLSANDLPGVILLDMELPEISGLELLKMLKQRYPELPVVMLTGNSESRTIIEVMKAGASEYVIKGDKGLIEQLKVRIHQALAHARLTTKSRKMEAKLLKQHQAYTLVGSSTSMLKLKRSLIPLRGTTASVVITGESGTGKELVARALNVQEEDSAERPFQAINCAAIPENLLESELFGHEKGAFTGAIASKPGKFVQADGGDLFLDEIGELPLAMQAKLLRALQEREVTPVGSNKPVKFEVRVICATNRDLKNEVAEGRFREDLYYRIATIELTIPPLRDRSEDIRELVTHFLKKCDCPHLKLSRDAMAAARKHRWPGNIRALHNSLERACIMVSGSGRIVIEKTDLFLPEACASKSDQELVPTHLIPTSIGQLSRDQYEELIHWAERTYFTSALKQVDQSRTQLAEKMGVSRSFVQERLKAVGMVRAERKIPEASTCAIN